MNLYKIHRKLSLIALLPVLAWTLSGVMHPLMSYFKPKVNARLAVNKEEKKTNQILISIDSVMRLKRWTNIQSFRLVNVDSSLYYQIKREGKNIYVSTVNGNTNENGEYEYATYLAGLYSGEQSSTIADISTQNSFSNEYVKIARILPVYKVAYKRMDGLSIFIDVNTDRMTYATNTIRSTFQAFFLWAHSWVFLSFNNIFRLSVLGAFITISFLAGFTGILVYTKYRKVYHLQNSAKVTWQRKLHRTLGIGLSFTLLLFALSAFMHMLPKYTALDKAIFEYQSVFSADELLFNFDQIQEPWINVKPVKVGHQSYFQFHFIKGRSIVKKYYNTTSGEELIKGDSIYAVHLAKSYSGLSKVKNTERISRFENEYGFINKLLPVQKVQFTREGNPRWYIDTETSFVGAIIEDKSALSGFIFAYFHKYHFFDFLGKGMRDIIMTSFALGNFLVSLLGFMMYLNTKKTTRERKRKKKELVY